MKKSILGLSIAAAMAQGTAIAAETDPHDESNWKASLMTEFVYFDHSADEFPEMEGFPMGGHNHGPREGLHTGHWEAILEGDISEHFKARFNLALLETEEEGLEHFWEEVYLQSKGLGNGLKFTLGRQYTETGYHTSKHNHEWDFVDQPLIIDALYGVHPIFDGARVNWLAPTDQYWEFGAEVSDGESFPAAGGNTWSLFAKTGGDIGDSSSWLAGAGYYRAGDVNNRTSEGHEHEGHDHGDASFTGDVDIWNVNAVYKWAPMGNIKTQNLTLQAEYFVKSEEGNLNLMESNGTDVHRHFNYEGEHSGFYAQAVYQWQPNWRVGYRYEQLNANNDLYYIAGLDPNVNRPANEDELEATLLHDDYSPKKQSLMLDYSPKHESRIRLQYNIDQRSGSVTDRQWLLQYSHSFGSHGAHAY